VAVKFPTILLAHGGGGRLTHELVAQAFLPAFRNPALETLSDSALLPELPPGRPALTTDSYVVDPVVFPGGDLGYLSVCGTVNDLAVAGARPLALTFALILEEGLDGELLEQLVAGAARAAAEAGVAIVAGDTKVVPRGKGDRAFATTAGLGVVPVGRDVGDHRITPGDVLLVSGPIADHGATIVACRHGLSGARLVSDCAPVNGLVEALLGSGADVHAMHDPTRGGVATTCNEVAGRAGVRIVLEETAVPVRPEVTGVGELLGLDPLYIACEGRVLAWVAAADEARALDALRGHPLGRGAATIGRVEARRSGQVPVALRSAYGVERPLDVLSGSELPRIC
jgi:hydrogenase expression/formation protein HypE